MENQLPIASPKAQHQCGVSLAGNLGMQHMWSWVPIQSAPPAQALASQEGRPAGPEVVLT